MSSRRLAPIAMGLALSVSTAFAADASLIDDFNQLPAGLRASTAVSLSRLEVLPTDPLALPGQTATEGMLQVVGPRHLDVRWPSGRFCHTGGTFDANREIAVGILTTPFFNASQVSLKTLTAANAYELHARKAGGSHLVDVDGDGDLDLSAHFRCGDLGALSYGNLPPVQALGDQGAYLTTHHDAGTMFRPLQGGQDWSVADGVSFWFHGTGGGDAIRFQLHDNRAPDAGAASWKLVWSDEFNAPAGPKPDPRNWTHEIGDGTANGIPGWGNEELEYYTDDAQNAATNGAGQLAITARQSDGSLSCYYGPCQIHLRAPRLAAQGGVRVRPHRSAHQVPSGAGLWPAFWSLGTNIADVGWPQTGEIDIMEVVGRVPNEVFGTIHGPGYSGGASFGGTHHFDVPVATTSTRSRSSGGRAASTGTSTGSVYHSATPADVAPNQWVFDHPFFLILNLAVGGNFGGPVAPTRAFPQSMLVDYIRVYRARTGRSASRPPSSTTRPAGRKSRCRGSASRAARGTRRVRRTTGSRSPASGVTASCCRKAV